MFKWPYRIHSRWFLAAPFPAGLSGSVGSPLLRPPSTGRLQLLSGNHKLTSVLTQHFPCSFSYPYLNLQMRNESKNLSLRTLIIGGKGLLGYLYAFALSTCCYILWLEKETSFVQSLILPCEDEISDDDVLSEPEVRSELLLLRDAKCAWSPESFLARSSDWSRIRKLWPLCPPPPPGSLQVWSLTLFYYCSFLQSKIIETRS